MIERCPVCLGMEWDGVPGGRYCRECRITYFDLGLAQRNATRAHEIAEAVRPWRDEVEYLWVQLGKGLGWMQCEASESNGKRVLFNALDHARALLDKEAK